MRRKTIDLAVVSLIVVGIALASMPIFARPASTQAATFGDSSNKNVRAMSDDGSSWYIRDDATGGDCTLIGNWDSDTKTCLLTQDVYETIVIESNGITLDGDGHTNSGSDWYGVYAYFVSGIAIKNLVIGGYGYGIWLDTSSSSTVSGNDILDTGIAIYLWYSTGIVLTGNAMNWGGIAIDGDSLAQWNTHAIDTSNTVNGRSVQYWKNVVRGKIPPNAGQVILANTRGVTVESQVISDVIVGIMLGFSSGNTIDSNTVFDSSLGVCLYSSVRNRISENTVSADSFGVFLEYSSDGNTVSGNTLSGMMGIDVIYSNGNIISGNIVSGKFPYGMSLRLADSSRNTVMGNVFSNSRYGIYVESWWDKQKSVGNIINGNIVNHNVYGIRLEYTSRNTLKNNVATSNGFSFGVWGIELADYIQDIDASNTIDGKPVYYWVNHNHETVPADAGYVGIVNSNHITVRDVTIKGNSDGILFAYTAESTIQNVLLSDNNYGITFYNSKDNEVRGNTVLWGYVGMLLDLSTGNVVTSNTISGNNGNSVVLNSADYNKINDNNLASPGYPVWMSSSNGNTISRNMISGKYDNIYLASSIDNTIKENTFLGEGLGVRVDDSSRNNMIKGNSFLGKSGGVIIFGTENTVRENVFSSPGWAVHLMYSNGANKIIGNVITGNSIGILLDYTSGAIISENTISGNAIGIKLSHSNGNVIFHNNFIDNVNQLVNKDSTNTWNNPKSEGNYWSDYTGLDDGSGGRKAGDGVGDTNIPHLGVDWYPLMDPWTN